jgi:hypothetical protein
MVIFFATLRYIHQLQKNNIETGRGYWAGILIKDNYLSGRHRAIKRDASKPCRGTFGS